MNYSVDYFPSKRLCDIKDIWKTLEQGKDMSLFQSYDWYIMLLNCYIPEDTNNFISVFAVVSCDNHPCMIAPLWIIKHSFRFINKKGIYLLGRDSYSDYLNFIYQQFDGNAFDYLIADIVKKYNVRKCTFENIRESTDFYQHIIHFNCYSAEDVRESCVSLDVPTSLEGYQSLLSKNARQNLRTANNRLLKDGRNLILCFDDKEVDKNHCLEIRESKLSVKYAKVSSLRKYKYRFVNKLLYHFPRFTPILTYSKSKVMTAKDENGNVRAFFHYAYDSDGHCVRVMSAGTDLDYARYSPGMLLMYGFIKWIIEEGTVHVVDFTRGDEKYKFVLGGDLNYNHKITISINR